MGVNEALARGEGPRPRQEGFVGAVSGFLRGISEGVESVQGGWGGDEGAGGWFPGLYNRRSVFGGQGRVSTGPC